MWRSILTYTLICACMGTAVVAFFHGLMTVGQVFIPHYATFWHFALDVMITAGLTALSIGIGTAAYHVDSATA